MGWPPLSYLHRSSPIECCLEPAALHFSQERLTGTHLLRDVSVHMLCFSPCMMLMRSYITGEQAELSTWSAAVKPAAPLPECMRAGTDQ